MNQHAWVSLIALIGCLILAFSSYRARRVAAGKTLVMGLAWIAIFLMVAAVFTAIRG